MFLKLVWTLFGRLGAAGLQAVTLILVARGTDVEEFGLIATFLGVAVFLHVTLDFGVTTYSLKEKMSGKDNVIFSGILHTALISAAVSFVLCSGLLALNRNGLASECLFLLPLFVWMAFERVTETLQILLQAEGNSRAYSGFLFFRRLLPLLCYLIFHFAGLESSWSFGCAQLFSSFVFCVISMRYISFGMVGERKGLVSVIKETKAYWMNSVFMQARALDVLVLSSFSGLSASAAFSAASRLSAPLSIIPTSVATVFLPIVAKRDSSLSYLNKLAVLGSLLCSAPMLLIALLTPYIVPFLLGDSFVGIIPVLQVLCVGLAFSSIATIYTAFLQGVGQAGKISQISFYVSIGYLLSLLIAAALLELSSVDASLFLLAFYIVRSFSVLFQTIKVFR